MRRLATALAALWLCAAAPVSYDAVCPLTCVAPDGTSQPAATILARGLWDQIQPWNPTDKNGLALAKVLTSNPPGALYQPAVTGAVAVPGTLSLNNLQLNAAGQIQGVYSDGSLTPAMIPNLIGDAAGTTAANTVGIQRPNYTPVAVTSGATVQLPSGFAYYDLSGSGVVAAATIKLPANPLDRQLARLITIGALSITVMTVQDASGNAVGSSLGLGVLSSALYQYQGSAWVRVGN